MLMIGMTTTAMMMLMMMTKMTLKKKLIWSVRYQSLSLPSLMVKQWAPPPASTKRPLKSRGTKRRRTEEKETKVLDTALQCIRTISKCKTQQGQENDDDDIFGKFVARELRGLSSDAKRAAKFRIRQVLYDVSSPAPQLHQSPGYGSYGSYGGLTQNNSVLYPSYSSNIQPMYSSQFMTAHGSHSQPYSSTSTGHESFNNMKSNFPYHTSHNPSPSSSSVTSPDSMNVASGQEQDGCCQI